MSTFLAFLQNLVASDKVALVNAALAAVTLLAANFGFNLNASETAYLGVLLTALAGAFTHVHFTRQAVKAARKP